MESTWNEKLSPNEENYLIAQFAYEVKRRGLEAPAVFFLESHKPLAGLASAFAVVTTPFSAPFLGIENVQGYGRLMESPGAIDRLLAAIEAPGEPVKPVRSFGNDETEMTSKDNEAGTGV
jgi:hypothetical protein